MSYVELKAMVADRLTGRFPSDGPQPRLDYGGKYDGYERLFVDMNWGRSLLNPMRRRRLLEKAQQLLAPLATKLHLCKGSGDYVLIVSESTESFS